MQWDALGFKENPFSTEPISQTTMDLYTGHNHELSSCFDVLHQKNVLLVVEGARGVGTTSFSNRMRFQLESEKLYFTPRNEIRVEPNWQLETLLAVVVANIVREIQYFQPSNILNDPRFINAKALSNRIAEAYRSFGIEAFGFGANYGKAAGITSMPIIVPSAVIGHHLEDLCSLVKSTMGYQYGILVQLNNLDIGAIHEEHHLRYLFNALRDYIQTDGISWILVGDVGLRRFIAQQVDRLDDIVSYEAEIGSLSKDEYITLIQKRIEHYRMNEKIISPIDSEVFLYLYEITHGRLRYIFGLLQRLVGSFRIGELTDTLTMDLAKPMIKKLAMERIIRNKLSPSEELLLVKIVELKRASVSEIAELLGKSINFVSNSLAKLIEHRLVLFQKEGRSRFYTPELDAIIAYSN